MPRMPLVAIVGPTAVGKSALLYRLIDAIGADRCEIINGDAIQHYRDLSIGTAKPPPVLRARYIHHLIDVLHPHERYSVVDFARRVQHVACAIVSRRRLPLLCGGSVYFMLHVLRGLPDTPPPCAALRHRLRHRIASGEAAALYAELTAVDPVAAARIAPTDHFRLLRKLEIYHTTGRRPSELARFSAGAAAFHSLCIKLTAPRTVLAERSARRLEHMCRAGLIDELWRLVARGYGPDTPALRAIGYRQFFHSDGRLRPLTTPQQRRAIMQDILKATARYAKHQLTFMHQIASPRVYRSDEFFAIACAVRAFLASRAVRQALC